MGSLRVIFFFYIQISWCFALDRQNFGPSQMRAPATGCFHILYMASVWKMPEMKGLRLHLHNCHVSEDFIHLLIG